MAEDEDLEVLGSIGSTRLSSADEETDEGADDEVEEGPHRPIVPGGTSANLGFRPPRAPKTDRSRRTIQLPAFAIAALRDQRRAQAEVRLAAGRLWLDNDLVFTGPTGGPIPPGSVTRRFQALLAGAGIGRLRFHDLRHAAATVMLAQGVELRVISETLGHSSLGMTADVYAGVVPALGRAAAARMDEALGGAR